MFGIALTHNISVAKLKKVNDILGENVYPGQIIKVPEMVEEQKETGKQEENVKEPEKSMAGDKNDKTIPKDTSRY